MFEEIKQQAQAAASELCSLANLKEGNLIVNVKESRIAISKEMASKIMV